MRRLLRLLRRRRGRRGCCLRSRGTRRDVRGRRTGCRALQGCDEITGWRRCRRCVRANDVARQEAGPAIEGLVRLVIDRHRRAVERHAGEQAAGTRVRVDLCGESYVGGGRALPADRPRGYRGIGAQRHFAADDSFDALPGREHQHHVRRLHADLEAEAAAGQVDEHRVAPLAAVFADHEHTFAATAADAEADLDDRGNHCDRVRSFEQPGRDVLLRHLHQLVEHARRRREARLLSLAGDGSEAECARDQADRDL